MASATEALQEALRELKLMEAALDNFEATRDKDKLAEVTTRMKQIGPKLKELCMMPECKTPQNAPHLIYLSNGMKAAVVRTKQLSAGGPSPAPATDRPHSASVSVPPSSGDAEYAGRAPALFNTIRFATRSGSVESTRSNTLSSSSDRSALKSSTERSTLTSSTGSTSTGSSGTISGIPPKALAGWLKKQGEKGLVKTFKRRYFSQKEFKLYYFKAEADTQPLGYIDLAAVISVSGVDKSPGVFDVATDKRIFRLQAGSAGDQLTWVEGIRAWRAYADLANSPAAALNRRSITIPNRPSQPPPPVPMSTDSLDAAPAPPGAPYVLAGAYPPPRPTNAPTPDPTLTPAPPSPKPTPSPSPSPAPVPASASMPTPVPSSSGSVTPTSGSYTASVAMKKSGDTIQRTSTPPVVPASAPSGSMRVPASASEPAALTPLSELLAGPSQSRSVATPSASPAPVPSPQPEASHGSQSALPSVASILSAPAPAPTPAAEPAPAPLSELLGGPPQPRSAPGTPSTSRAVVQPSPAASAVPASTSGSVRMPATPTERRLAGDVNPIPSPSFERSEESVQRYRQVAESLERELTAKNQQLEALTKELRKRDEAAKNSPSILSTIAATDKDGAVMAMEKMIRDLEISLRTKEQQNDDLKVQLAQKTEESRIKDSKIESLTAINARQLEDVKAKDDVIAKLGDQIQNMKLAANGRQGDLDDRVRMELSKVRISIAAHQSHNSFLESELSRLERDHKAVLEAKQGTIESLQRTLAEARHEHAMFRRKILLQKGADDKFLNELEDAKRELFSALALGIKLNLAMAGEAMTIDVTSLYDEAKDMDFRTWNDWIFRKLRDALPPKQPVRRRTNWNGV